MHAKIIDLNNSNAYLILVDGSIVSVPINRLNNHTVGEYVFYPPIPQSLKNNHNNFY